MADLLVAVVALVTLVPAAVLVRPSLQLKLYGLDLSSVPKEVSLIVRHRAVFFALTAILLGLGRVMPSFWLPGLSLAVSSKAAFVVLAYQSRTLLSIARVDLVLIGALLLAAWLGGDTLAAR